MHTTPSTPSFQVLARLLRSTTAAEASDLVQPLDPRFAEQTLGALTRLLLSAGPAPRAQRDHDDAVTLFLQVLSARYDHVIERADAGLLFAVGPAVRGALQGVIEARRTAMAGATAPRVDPAPQPHRPGWW